MTHPTKTAALTHLLENIMNEAIATLVTNPDGSTSVHQPFTPDIQLGEGHSIEPLFLGLEPSPSSRIEWAASHSACRNAIDSEDFYEFLILKGIDCLAKEYVNDRGAVDSRDRFDKRGKVLYMTRAGQYVMVQRPRGMPFILTLNKWISMGIKPLDERA